MGINMPRCQQKSIWCFERPGSSGLFFCCCLMFCFVLFSGRERNILGFAGQSGSVSLKTSQLCPSGVKATDNI